jgi:DNA-binding SARP family transcriptional activator/TolB-like protein
MPEPGRIRLQLLGRFATCVVGTSARHVTIAGRQRRALLAYLAMQPGFTETRERLAALLWSERAERQARQNLRQCLLELRREFEACGIEPLKVDRETVALDPGLISTDVDEFLTLSRSEDVADLQRAMGLYAGPFLDGFDTDDGVFHDWIREQRARFESVAAVAFEKSALRQDESGDGGQSIQAAERLVALDPLRESAQRLLIRLLARHVGRDAALARAGALTEKLRAELGVEPERETAALIAEIKSSSTAAAAPVTVRPANGEMDHPATGLESTAASVDSRLAWWRTAFSRPNRVAWPAAGIGIVAISALAFVLVGRDQTAQQQSEPQAAPAVAESPPTGQSPGIMAGVTVDKAALAALGYSAVVVLPFTTSDGPDNGSDKRVADRITDDLINDLSRIPPLRVIARQTSRLYAGQPIDVAAIGAELGVRYVVEGNVQFLKPNLRINVSLVDATTRLQVWSERFERDYAEQSAVQDEIVRGIARALHLKVLAHEDQRRPAAAPQNAGIDELLSKGWYAMANNAVLGLTGPAHYFGEVLQRDSNNVPAMIGLGGYHVVLIDRFLVADNGDHLERAEELLRKAIEKNPNSVMSYYFLGILHRLRGQRPEALAAFAKALEHNPSLPLAYAQTGDVLAHMGRLDQAMDHIQYAIRLSPKDPSLGLFSLFAGKIELQRGNNEAATTWLKRAVELAPRSALSHAILAAAFALQNDKAASAKYAALAKGIAPWLTQDRLVQRVADETEAGVEPRRLIEGLNKAFGNPG